MLLILTNRFDVAVDYTILRLRERGVPFFRFNVDEFPADASVSWSLSAGRVTGRVRRGRREARLENVSVVWYRRGLQPERFDGLDEETLLFARRESRHLLEGAFLSIDAPWVNPLPAVMAAERKLYQLRVASPCGFSIPCTAAGNACDDLLRFAAEVREPGGRLRGAGEVVCKPVCSGFQPGRDRDHAVYARTIDAGDIEGPEAVRLCPAILQKRVFKSADVRATFVGDRYVAAAIRTLDGTLDWRRPGASLRYERYLLPDGTLAKCRELMRRLGLVYGAFDFALEPTGDLAFLEVNPAGEWAWLDKELGTDTRDDLIDLFENVRGSGRW